MRAVERESFLKSFFLFFFSLTSLILALFYLAYEKELSNLDKNILSSMQLCSYSLDCEQFMIDFSTIEQQDIYILYQNKEELFTFNPIPNSDEFYLKISFSNRDYQKEVSIIKKEIFYYLLGTSIIIIILSIIFSFYALYPLKNALHLTREFVKDILHDFNTPISTMRLNLSLLDKEVGENRKIERIKRSIENILLLQENLKHYLIQKENSKEIVLLKELLDERVLMIEKNYPYLTYIIQIDKNVKIYQNKKSFTRIIDNLISNASKYNKKDGTITVLYNEKEKQLTIKDTGYGIKNTKLVFNRFYKEQEEGVGIGLHIVKKLCEELEIKIAIKSNQKRGTMITLTLY